MKPTAIDWDKEWYHGSDREFGILRSKSTITQWKELAEAFSHQPSALWIDDEDKIGHNGSKDGFLYVIDEPINSDDLEPVPNSTMEPCLELHTRRPFRVRMLKPLLSISHFDGREVLAEDYRIRVVQYSHDDDRWFYEAWLDPETQRGYNGMFDEPFDEFRSDDIERFRFYGSIIEKRTGEMIGVLRLSPLPYDLDLAIWVFRAFSNMGYGTRAFRLGLRYCFDVLELDRIWAGCYEDNIRSMRMLEKLGFERDRDGDSLETSAFTGEPITQLSFIIRADTFDRKTNFTSD